MQYVTFYSLLAIVLAISGCVTMLESPSETTVVDVTFTVTVPKDLQEAANSGLKGLRLGAFEHRQGRSPIRNFFSVRFKEVPATSELITEICQGDLHDDGGRYQSCIFYDARVAITEDDTSFHIALSPYRVRAAPGRNAIFLPIALPDAPLNTWYRWVSSQRVVTRLKSTSPFIPESIKGNFDRNFRRYAWREGQTDTALRQFKDTYILPVGQDVVVKIGASFYPYRTGTLVEVYMQGSADSTEGIRTRDWQATLTSTKAKIDQVIKE